MDELINTIRKNKRMILIVLPLLMAAIFAFLPIIDVLGKGTADGINLIFHGENRGIKIFGGEDFEFSRFCAAMALLLPMAAAVLQFVKVNLPAFNMVWAGASLIFAVLMAIAFPDGCSLAWGGYLYCLLAVVGIAIGFLPKR